MIKFHTKELEIYAIKGDGMHKTIMTYGINIISNTFSNSPLVSVDNISDSDKFSSVSFALSILDVDYALKAVKKSPKIPREIKVTLAY